MLQIKLKSEGGPSTEGGEGVKASSGGEATTVAYPNHLNVADLVVAKSLGSVTAAPVVKIVGRKARPQMGERVHICLRCDFPIAIYGRLSPCDHAFCLDCARSDPTCSICDERIQKIQTMRVHEGIWICAAPQCFKSFLKKDEFDTHVHGSHGDLIKKIDSEATSAKKPTSESIVQAAAKSALSSSSISGPTSFQQTQNSAPDGKQRQGSVLGFPPRPVVASVNFLGNYPQPLGVGPTGGFSDPSVVGRENVDAFKNLSMSDSRGRVAGFQGKFKQNEPSALQPVANKDVDHMSGQNASESRVVMGMLPPPPGSHPPHSSQLNRFRPSTGGASHDAN
ncbi:RING-type E3 ubiquitin transferase [Heracleum sosnowskyi]|uniref:RING-type E3 ubiquitin transferase n=1 Tax=Heracleum sosnowskyi TaxID=360622 RepID=A0AAD8HYN4_9APIA|nr:RING-type E3 ubiquitin transferase [Heracleum sosnowskyi]